MKFEEKLIKLRKDLGLSQEELGEKLDVTRQTISKWELGQSKPDMDKIIEMAKLFNISTDELLNESAETIEQNSNTSEGKGKNKKNTIIIVILLAILVVAICVGLFFTLRSFFSIPGKIQEKAFNNFDKAVNKIIEKGEEYKNEQEEKFNNSVNTIIEKQNEQIKEYENEASDRFNNAVNTMTDQFKNSANEIGNQITDSVGNFIQQFQF